MSFFELYSGLPQYGPGSNDSTLRALHRLSGELPALPRVFDLGCGGGRQTLVLARSLKTRVVAVELHRPYLDELRKSADEEGLGELIETRCCSMVELGEPEESIDVIWCEGAAYSVGVRNALQDWQPLLRPGGRVAFTELNWLTDTPDQRAAEYWRAAYPDIDTASGTRRIAEETGYTVTDEFVLPFDDWRAYHRPLQEAMQRLRPRAAHDPDLSAVIQETEREIEMYERFPNQVGYTFFLLRKA